MMKFSEYLAEAADSKQNLHLTHSDEDLFERGDKGAKAGVESIIDVVKTVGKGNTKLTVKWDGAPAVFAGWDPADGKFFVGTKSVFNKNPKIYKTEQEVKAGESGGKAEKLVWCIRELPNIGIPKGTVLQGDLLWTKGDQKYETIEGKRWITVHPNTIVYAWPAQSEIGKRVRNANMGIVWHTTYKGRGDLSTYSASFGVDSTKLKQTRGCWSDDAYFKGVDIAFDEPEYKEIIGLAMKAQSKIGGFDKIVKIMDTLPSGQVGAGIKTFINSKIRGGELPNPKTAAKEYIPYVEKYWEEKVLSKVKSEKGMETKKAALKQLVKELKGVMPELQKAFEYVDLITQAKVMIIKKLNSINKQKSFVLTKGGFKVTDAEGFVAINTKKGEATKFVDRLAFSHFNFSPDYIKGWQR